MLGFLNKLFGKTPPEGVAVASPLPKNSLIERPPKANGNSAAPHPVLNGAITGDSIHIPIRALLSKFPEQIRAVVSGAALHAESVAIPLALVLEQLPKGSVKIAYSDLIRGSTPGLFPPENPAESISIELPLREILPRLKPNQLPRRNGQRAGDIPAEIVSPFASTSQEKPGTRINLPVAPISSVLPNGSPILPLVVPKTDEFAGASVAREESVAEIKLPPATEIHDKASELDEVISVPLSVLGPAFNSALRAQFPGHASKTLNMPRELIESELKRGRLIFPLKLVASWLDPVREAHGVEDDQKIELPLNVIAPILFDGGATKNGRPMAGAPETIPDLFQSAKPAPPAPVQSASPAPPPTTAPEPAPQIIALETSDEPAKTVATLIHELSSLPGIDGAIAATIDGFLVAGAGLNGFSHQSFAAFGPHMFNRLLQYGGDLQLGEARTLTIYFDQKPMRLFRAGRLLIIIAGRPLAPFPDTEIEKLAAKLAQANT